jgi:hypothetical protein
VHRFTSDELLLAHTQLHERLATTLAVVTNIARKSKPEHLPAGFRALVRSNTAAPIIQARDGAFSLIWRIPGFTTQPLVLPARLLRASDRDVATWARAEVNRCRPNAINRQRTALDREIADLEARHARLERDLSVKRAQRENLPRARRKEATRG